MQKNTLLLIGAVVVLAVLGVGAYVMLKPSQTAPSSSVPPMSLPAASGAKVVTYSAGVFTPLSLTVRVGQTVEFRNQDSSNMWVASDPHPVHTDLAGFDAGRGYSQGETYSYAFSKAGTFGYHDHLSPSARGTVIVQH